MVFLHEAGSSAIFTGGALMFAGALAYARFFVGSGRMIQRLGATRFTALTMIMAGLACIASFWRSAPVSCPGAASCGIHPGTGNGFAIDGCSGFPAFSGHSPHRSETRRTARIFQSDFNNPSGMDFPGRATDCRRDRRNRPGTCRNVAATRGRRRLAPMTWRAPRPAQLEPGGTTPVAPGCYF